MMRNPRVAESPVLIGVGRSSRPARVAGRLERLVAFDHPRGFPQCTWRKVAA